MKIVFFGEELHERAPAVIGMLCSEPDMEWVGLVDVVAAMRRGETVTIRPASLTEMQRAENIVALCQIGEQLGHRIGAILDQNCGVSDPKVAMGAVTEIRDAIENALDESVAPYKLLDE